MDEKHEFGDAASRDDRSQSAINDTRATSTADPKDENDYRNYPPRKVVIPAVAAIYLAIFLIALDRTILGTAIPAITNEFNSFGDTAWYEAGYLLPLCALQLTFGRVYTHYSVKWILVAQVAIFEIGSIVCATAQTSNALIVGRAVSGLGSAGLISGGTITFNQLLPLQVRPKVSGGIGAVFGISSILGPLLGGYLTAVTWRWCFWINVPIGGLALVVLTFLLPKRPPPVKTGETWLEKIKQLDPLGFILIAPSIICLLFAVQFGGTKYPQNSPTVIALYVVFGVLFVAFIASQIWLGEKATVPPRIFRQRSVLFGGIATIGIGSILVILPYYLPIWFQVIQGKSPQASGLSLIALLLSNVLLVIVCGILTSTFGYYTQFGIIGGALLIVGTALISTWQVDTDTGRWIGYQIIAGAGLGLMLQGPQIAAQTVLSQADVSIGLTLLTFVNFLGGTVFVTVCQNLLNNQLVSNLAPVIPNFDPSIVANGGATTLRNSVSPDVLPAVLEAYNQSIQKIWYLALGLACLAFLASFGLEWKSVRKEGKKDGGSPV